MKNDLFSPTTNEQKELKKALLQVQVNCVFGLNRIEKIARESSYSMYLCSLSHWKWIWFNWLAILRECIVNSYFYWLPLLKSFADIFTNGTLASTVITFIFLQLICLTTGFHLKLSNLSTYLELDTPNRKYLYVACCTIFAVWLFLNFSLCLQD